MRDENKEQIQEPKINIKQPLTLSHFSYMMGSYPRNEDNTGHELEKQEFLSEECGGGHQRKTKIIMVSVIYFRLRILCLIMSVFMGK